MDSDGVVEWGRERAPELLALVDVAYPDDRLSLDELQIACWGRARTVLGFADGSGAVAVRFEGTRATLDVLAASARAERRDDRRLGGSAGYRALLEAAADAATRNGAERVVVGGSVPDHLWPGLPDVEGPAMGDLTAVGFRQSADVEVYDVPTTFRAPVPDGFRIERVVDEGLVAQVDAWVRDLEPTWLPVVDRGVAQATCLVAVELASEEVEGLVTHSVGRDGWIGPMAVSSGSRRRGLGTALLAQACRDLLIAGLREAPFACLPQAAADRQPSGSTREPVDVAVPGAPWPTDFLTSVGARRWRTFRRYERTLS